MRISFYGDFVAPQIVGLEISQELSNIISSSDANVINCEAVTIDCLLERYSKLAKSGPNISQCKDSPQWLEKKGFNYISLANNHILDYGENALNDTINSFHNSTVFGVGRWGEAYKPIIVECEQKKIAIFGLTQSEFGTLNDKWDQQQKCGAAWINHPSIDKLIVETRQSVDYLFVFAHAGVEHLNQPLPEWRDRYRTLIDLGCDGVVASHPHIVQGWEFYKGKPIVYSLGNFYFPKSSNTAFTWNRSIVATIDIARNGGVSLSITPISFTEGFIEVDKTEKTRDSLDVVNRILHDEVEYINAINQASLSHLEIFYTMFQNGGLSRSFTYKKITRAFLALLKGQINYNPAWLYNNLQCESHRWLFIRGHKLINKLK